MLINEIISYELEGRRKNALSELEQAVPAIARLAKSFFNLPAEPSVYPIGAVTTGRNFHENTDIDVGVFISNRRDLSTEKSQKFQKYLSKKIRFAFGLLNTIVFD